MKPPLYDAKAPKRTVSLTINADVYAQAKKLDVNASQVAEEALIQELVRRHAERIRAEIATDLDACDAYAAKHGSFAEMVREHYASTDEE